MGTELETKVAVLERDVHQITDLFTRLDTAIAKIGDLANGISRLLAVHEERLAAHANTDQDLYELVEGRRVELKAEITDLKDTITKQSQESQARVMSAIEDLKKMMAEADRAKDIRISANDKRITSLERWRWVLIGGGAVIGFILSDFLPMVVRILTK